LKNSPDSEPFWICLPEIRKIILKYSKQDISPLKLNTLLRQEFTAEQCRQLTQQISLHPLIFQKFGDMPDIFCDRYALEQATSREIGEYKSGLIPPNTKVADLCCGMGGDSFFLHRSVHTTGYDLDTTRLKMYDFNLKNLNRNYSIQLQDVCNREYTEDFILIDPARRDDYNGPKWDPRSLNPGMEWLQSMISKGYHCLIKLPPGIQHSLQSPTLDTEYIGGHRDCREQLIRSGFLASAEPMVRAICVHTKAQFEYPAQDLKKKHLPVKNPGEFLYEPTPVMRRSRLFIPLGQNLDLWQADTHNSWLSGDRPVHHPFLNGFKILGRTGNNRNRIKNLLKDFNIGPLSIKSRNVELDPALEIKKLNSKGEQSGVLIYTRIEGKDITFLCQPLLQNEDSHSQTMEN
jgi:hypothetical protein